MNELVAPIVSKGVLGVTVHAPGGVSMALPPVIADAGEHAGRLALEIFSAGIPNAHTRRRTATPFSASARGRRRKA